MQLYASKQLVEKEGKPETLDDLSRYRLICQNPRSAQVGAGAKMVSDLMSHNITSLLTVNNYFGVLQGVLNNVGIGVLPDYLTYDFPELVSILPKVRSSEVPVFLAYPEELRHSKRISAFRDFVQEEIILYRKHLNK
jgi:DNA-binding transcriptional LysR family regulator